MSKELDYNLGHYDKERVISILKIILEKYCPPYAAGIATIYYPRNPEKLYQKLMKPKTKYWEMKEMVIKVLNNQISI